MTEESTPAASNSIAALCRRTCGETRLPLRVGQRAAAPCAYLRTRYCTLSALRRPPRAFGKRTSVWGLGSLSQDLRTAAVPVVSGVERSLRPLPRQRTWAPAPKVIADRSRLVSSE